MKHVFSMVGAGVFLAVFFLVLHLSGGRGYVGILSGTMTGGAGEALLGIVYALSWFGAVLVAPVLVLAGILATVSRPVGARRGYRTSSRASFQL